MSNKQISDSVFEALFRQAVIDDYVEEINSIPSNEELAKKYSFSPMFDLRMRKLFIREVRKEILITSMKYAKRVAVIILVVTTTFFGILLSNSEVRAAVGKVIVEWYEQFTSFTFDKDSSIVEKKELRLAYIPDGYFEDTVEILGNVTYVIFQNNDGDIIRFSYRAGDNISNFSVDNENHLIEETALKENLAFVVSAINDKSENGIICSVGNHVIEIWGKVPVEELKNMVESIS